ncbi:MAG: hypothetical protein H0W34_07475 [Pyrinomonadaceae bacterium]|nr:hypothetical protein [Pyrinomonadaceae bacterium]
MNTQIDPAALTLQPFNRSSHERYFRFRASRRKRTCVSLRADPVFQKLCEEKKPWATVERGIASVAPADLKH